MPVQKNPFLLPKLQFEKQVTEAWDSHTPGPRGPWGPGRPSGRGKAVLFT